MPTIGRVWWPCLYSERSGSSRADLSRIMLTSLTSLGFSEDMRRSTATLMQPMLVRRNCLHVFSLAHQAPFLPECRGAAASSAATRAREKQAIGEKHGRQQSSTGRSSRRSSSGSLGRSSSRSSSRSNSGSSRTRVRAVLGGGAGLGGSGRPVLGSSAGLGGGRRAVLGGAQVGAAGGDRGGVGLGGGGDARGESRLEGIAAGRRRPLAMLGRRAEEEDGAEGPV